MLIQTYFKNEDNMKRLLTTPIYYVNDVPHIGHAYTTIIADVMKKYWTLQGDEVFLLTGTDEHGQKIEEAAEKHNIRTIEYVDSISQRFRDTWKMFEIDYDKFIRTTYLEHILSVQKAFKIMYDKGDIYKGEYEGRYCVSCESFSATPGGAMVTAVIFLHPDASAHSSAAPSNGFRSPLQYFTATIIFLSFMGKAPKKFGRLLIARIQLIVYGNILFIRHNHAGVFATRFRRRLQGREKPRGDTRAHCRTERRINVFHRNQYYADRIRHNLSPQSTLSPSANEDGGI